MKTAIHSRRRFMQRLAASGAVLSLHYSPAGLAATPTPPTPIYRSFEDLYRAKWKWDRVAHGTHGTNCAGNCAFNVYVKNG
ncbi:MAG: hypothetical protein KDI32_09470, partial [Pseudomonadales bacterium]|nr:hypothetical protein [Pseudomonadales bacterium]